MKKRNNGISLLVLIITIIVMIILASAVILSITGNNPISRANETKVKTDLTALKDEYNNFYSSALFDNVSNTKGYYTDKMNITKEGNIIYKGKIVNEGENNSLASIMPSIVGTEYEGKVFVADGKIYIDNRDNFLSEEQQEWAKEVGINVLNEGEVLVLSTEEVSLKISQKERIYATVLPDIDSQVDFEIDEPTKARIIEEKENTVDIQGISDGVAILTAKVTAEDGTEIEKKVTIKVNVGDYIKVEKITIDPSSVVLGLDEPAKLRAIITPETADNQDVSWEVESQSPDNAVDLTQTGEVTGRDIGTAKIIAKGEYGNLTSEVCSVSVIDKTKITLDKQTLQLRKGQEGKLQAIVENGNVREGTLTWETSDDAKVGVDQEGNITAKEVGSATITAKYLTKSVTCQVEVLDPLELSAEVTEARGTKATLKISANTTYNQIDKIEIKHREKGKEDWITDPSIDVNKTEYNTNDYVINGLEPRKIFEIKVVATLKDKSCQKEVTLQAEPKWIPVTSISVAPDTLNVYLGETGKLTATVLPEDASDKTVIWESSDQNKAIVSEGVITTKDVGNTTITAKANDDKEKQAQCSVKVLEPISLKASVSATTSSTIPVQVTTSTKHGTLSKITIMYKREDEATWSKKEVTQDVTGQTEYEGIITIDNLKDVTKYNIQVEVEIASESQYANGHKVSITDLTGTTLKIPVNNVTLSPKPLNVYLGDTGELTATIDPTNATNKSLTWQSSQTDIAEVDGGTVTTKQIGDTTVTVTSQDNPQASDTCQVHVIEPISLEATPDTTTSDTIPVEITTSTLFGTLSSIEIKYKENGTQQNWKTETLTTSDIGEGKQSYGGTYTIKGLEPYTTYDIEVTVTISTGHKYTKGEITAKTKKIDVTKVTLDKTEDTVFIEDTKTIQLTATVEPENASNKEVTWTTDNEGVATVEGNELNATVTIKGVGQAKITVTSKDNEAMKAEYTVNVVEAVAQIGAIKYATLQEAFNAVTGSSSSYNEVVVLKDITNKTATLANNKYAKLNLGTYTVKNDQGDKATITNEGYMEIVGEGTISSTGENAIYNANTLTINTSGIITSNQDAIDNTKTLTVANGTIKSTGNDENNSHGINNSSTQGNVNITGGDVEGYNAIKNNGKITMSEGTIKSLKQNAIEFAKGEIEITGGSITGVNGVFNSGNDVEKTLTFGNNSDEGVKKEAPIINVTETGVDNGNDKFKVNFYDGSVTGKIQFKNKETVVVPDMYEIVVNENTATLEHIKPVARIVDINSSEEMESFYTFDEALIYYCEYVTYEDGEFKLELLHDTTINDGSFIELFEDDKNYDIDLCNHKILYNASIMAIVNQASNCNIKIENGEMEFKEISTNTGAVSLESYGTNNLFSLYNLSISTNKESAIEAGIYDNKLSIERWNDNITVR